MTTPLKGAFALSKSITSSVICRRPCLLIFATHRYSSPPRSGPRLNASWRWSGPQRSNFLFIRRLQALEVSSREFLIRFTSRDLPCDPQRSITGWSMGAMPLIFFSKASSGGQVIIACLCAGMLGGGAFVLACIPAAAVAFTAPIVLASAITIGSSGDVAYFLVAVLMVSYVSVLWRGIYVHALQLVRRVSAQVNAERKVRRDELTNLSNRLALFEALESAFARLARLGEAFALLYLDLDEFKSVNDRYGHAAGDGLLVQVAQRLKGCARVIDVVARLSDDEFAIVVASAENVAAITALADRIVGSLNCAFLVDGVTISTGACIGIALAPTNGATSELLLKSADEALYDAKRRSRNVIRLHARDMDTRAA